MLATVVFNQNHPPATGNLTGSFSNISQRLLILFSGSAWTHNAPTLISANLMIDGNVITSASVWANESISHKALVTARIVITLNPGTHNVVIVPTGANTIIDFNDVFTLTVMEMP